MLVNTVARKSAHNQIASVALALAVFGSACGATAAQQSIAGTGAGSFSVDYDTAQHLGRLDRGAGATSLDYDTARHLGRPDGGAGSTSLDYDTAQHMGPRGVEVKVP